jgi:hypothetical protein
MFLVKTGRDALVYGYRLANAGIPFTAYAGATTVESIGEVTLEQLPNLWCFYNRELDCTLASLGKRDSGFWCLPRTISR